MSKEKGRKVVITGMGAVSPIGNDIKSMWEAAKNGVCGIDTITQYDTSEQKVHLAGEVKGDEWKEVIDKREIRRMDRYSQLALAAAVEAMRDSGMEEYLSSGSEEAEKLKLRFATLVSSGIGGIGTIESEHAKGEEKGFDRVSPFYIPMSISNMGAAWIAIRFGLHGMCSCSVTACASSGYSIGEGLRLIRDGYADAAICGGSEASITPLSVGGFTSMKALSNSDDKTRASIPFDAERSGFVMGEGAGMLILEEEEHAKKRGAHIYAEIAGFGANCDAYHITAPDPDAKMAVECLKEALEDAGMEPSDIDYINAHGTSTPLNDKGETKAIRAAFGEYADALSVSSTKSMTGHLLGASAVVGSIFAIKAIEDSFVPPTIGYKVPDPECDLDITPNVGKEREVRASICNSLGFGGHNASLVFKKY